jgi:dTMP kinase
MFIVFDGVDGAGKSTQLRLFVEWLRRFEIDVVTCCDPGTTSLGSRLRAMLLDNHSIPIDMRSEALMFMTARAQLVSEFIRPAIDHGKTVVCDRYVFSTVVYQGHAGELDPDDLWRLNAFATGGLMADLTFIFDLDAKAAQQRLGKSLDRMESRDLSYFEKVRQGFIYESARWPRGVEVIDASTSIEQVHSEVRAIAEKYLQNRRT